MPLVVINDYSELDRLCFEPSCIILPRTKWQDDHPEIHLVLVNEDNVLQARCSLWWQHTPELEGKRTGFIGHFDASDLQDGKELLSYACDLLRQQRCDIVLGPIDGSTWKTYRFITETSDYPAFFLEPVSKAECLESFIAGGFKPRAEYVSLMSSSMDWQDNRIDAAAVLLQEQGFALRTINTSNIDEDLRRIHALSLEGFSKNVLYTPITVSEFLRLYEPVKQLINPELVLLVEHNNELVGFIFAIPDIAQAQRGEHIDTVIIKTLVVSPQFTRRHIGNWLSKTLYDRARELGFRQAIHALMIEDNISRAMHSAGAKVIRRYTLFSRQTDGDL